MKVLLRRNVSNLGKIGEVVEVKAGYARNYLLPQRLAVQPTAGNLKAVEAEKQKYLEQLARERAELQVQAQLLEGKQVSIPTRANAEGHLYGSIGPAQIVAALAAMNIFIEPKTILLENAIRQLGDYDVVVSFIEDIRATIHVQVVPLRDDAGNVIPPDEAPAAEPAEDASDESAE
jgi:large subunit ribosomal protein L9